MQRQKPSCSCSPHHLQVNGRIYHCFNSLPMLTGSFLEPKFSCIKSSIGAHGIKLNVEKIRLFKSALCDCSDFTETPNYKLVLGSKFSLKSQDSSDRTQNPSVF